MYVCVYIYIYIYMHSPLLEVDQCNGDVTDSSQYVKSWNLRSRVSNRPELFAYFHFTIPFESSDPPLDLGIPPLKILRLVVIISSRKISNRGSGIPYPNTYPNTYHYVLNHGDSIIWLRRCMYACKNSKPQGLEEHLRHELLKTVCIFSFEVFSLPLAERKPKLNLYNTWSFETDCMFNLWGISSPLAERKPNLNFPYWLPLLTV